MSPKISTAGYKQITLHGDKNVSVDVHRLVAIAFIPNPDNKYSVNHKDGDKMNNRVENLEWADYSEQMRHAYDRKLIKNRPIDRLDMDGNYIDSWESIREYEQFVGKKLNHISSVLSGKRDHAYGYKWRVRII